ALACECDVDRLKFETCCRRAGSSRSRLRALQRDGLPTRGGSDRPRLGLPLRRQIEHLLVRVREADLAELVQHPLGVLCVGFRSRNAAPELRMTVIAIAARYCGLLFHILLEMIAVDRR